jgi:hypothetical protein
MGWYSSGSRIVCSSANVGNRQPDAPPKLSTFSVCKNTVKAEPSSFALSPSSIAHVYRLATSLMLPSVVFFSQTNPVSASATVPSPLSAYRGRSHAVPLSVWSFGHSVPYLIRHRESVATLQSRPP